MADSYNELFGLGTHSADANLEGWWKLDETSGTTIADSSGNGNDGTLQGGRTAADLTTSANAAWNTSSLSFNRTADYIEVPVSLSSIPVTFGCLSATNSLANTQTVISFADTSHTSRYWALESCRVKATPDNGMVIRNTTYYRENGVPADLDPVQLVCNAASWTSKKLYIDGVEDEEDTRSVSPFTASGLCIGALQRTSVSEYHGGQIEEAWLFSRSLAATEVAETGTGPEPLNLTAPSVTGTHETGETLSSSTGSWDSQSNGTITYTYQWQTATDAFGTGLADISGATSSSYTLTASEEGLYVRCLVRGSNDGGHDAAEDTGSAFTLASAGGGGGPSPTGFPFGIYYRGAACV